MDTSDLEKLIADANTILKLRYSSEYSRDMDTLRKAGWVISNVRVHTKSASLHAHKNKWHIFGEWYRHSWRWSLNIQYESGAVFLSARVNEVLQFIETEAWVEPGIAILKNSGYEGIKPDSANARINATVVCERATAFAALSSASMVVEYATLSRTHCGWLFRPSQDFTSWLVPLEATHILSGKIKIIGLCSLNGRYISDEIQKPGIITYARIAFANCHYNIITDGHKVFIEAGDVAVSTPIALSPKHTKAIGKLLGNMVISPS